METNTLQYDTIPWRHKLSHPEYIIIYNSCFSNQYQFHVEYTMDAPSRTSLRQGTGKRKSTLREGDHEWYDDTVKVKRTEVPTGNYKIDNYNI